MLDAGPKLPLGIVVMGVSCSRETHPTASGCATVAGSLARGPLPVVFTDGSRSECSKNTGSSSCSMQGGELHSMMLGDFSSDSDLLPDILSLLLPPISAALSVWICI
jgi:hypothetical protein